MCRVSGKVELPHWINAGVYVFDRAMGPLMPELGDHEVSTFPDLASQGRISAFKSKEFWRSVDSFKDLREAEEYIRETQPGTEARAETRKNSGDNYQPGMVNQVSQAAARVKENSGVSW